MIDLKKAMREMWGKCPTCNQKVTAGRWLKWCKPCNYVAPLVATQTLEN